MIAPVHCAGCPKCGSVLRRFDMSINGSLKFHSKLTAKARHKDEKRPFLEQVVGDDLDRKTGRWMKLHRLIDRVRDRYRERVTNPETGEVIHKCDEPLTQHKGHGSAKRSDAALLDK